MHSHIEKENPNFFDDDVLILVVMEDALAQK